MTRTNTRTTQRTTVPRTHEGMAVRNISNVQAFRRAVVSTLLFEDQFYEQGEDIAQRIRTLALSVPVEVAVTTAIEARTKFKLRHAPLWIAVALAGGSADQKRVVRKLLPQIIQRPDEMAELLSLYWKNREPQGPKKVANGILRGLADTFPKFDAYALAKYNRDDPIKLRDVLFLSHAKPKDDAQAAMWKQLIEGTLPIPDTWETQLSGGADKKATFERLIAEKKLGALALLRNLRNMEQAGVPYGIVKQALLDMKTERVLPFRFITAARYANVYRDELELAMFKCLAGQPMLAGKTKLLIDVSGSMDQAKVSAKSELTRMDAAMALAMLCRELCVDVDVITFSNEARKVGRLRGFKLAEAVTHSQPHQGTYGQKAVELANNDGYDRIICITDGQWQNAPGQWLNSLQPANINPLPNTKAYMVNIAAYRNAVGNAGQWQSIDGWSEAIIDYIQAVEAVDVESLTTPATAEV